MVNKIGDRLITDESFSKQDIEDNLHDAAEKIQTGSYTVLLTEKEKTERRKTLSEVMIEILDLERQKKEFVDSIKAKIKPLDEYKSELINSIKHGSEHRKGKLYYYPDYSDNKMYIFDSESTCIEIRPLRAEERQTNILTFNKAQNE